MLQTLKIRTINKYVNKFENLNDMDKLLENYELP